MGKSEKAHGQSRASRGNANNHSASRTRLAVIGIVLVIMTVFGLIGQPGSALACEPAPWTFAQAAESSVAAVQGVVTQVTKEGRQATLDVKSYVGPDKAPQTVMLPETVDSRDNGNVCPDFSTKFKVGDAYVVLLSDIAPVVKLAFPQGMTAFPVQGEQLTISYPSGEQAPLLQQLERFAETKQTAVQYPTRSSPVWYASGGYEARKLLLGGLLFVVVAGGSALWLRSRRRRG